MYYYNVTSEYFFRVSSIFRSFLRFNFATTCIDVEKPECEVLIRVILSFYKLANRDLKNIRKHIKFVSLIKNVFVKIYSHRTRCKLAIIWANWLIICVARSSFNARSISSSIRWILWQSKTLPRIHATLLGMSLTGYANTHVRYLYTAIGRACHLMASETWNLVRVLRMHAFRVFAS